MEAGILFALVLVLLFLGVPIAVALGLSSIIIIAFFSTDSMSSVNSHDDLTLSNHRSLRGPPAAR